MAQVKSTDWVRHIPKLLIAGAVLVIISIFLPATHNFESASYYGYTIRLTELIWYFGLYYFSVSGIPGYSESDFDFIDTDEYLTWGIAAIVLYIIAFILMIIAVSRERSENDHKTAAPTGLLGGILVFIGLGVYYGGLEYEFPGFWNVGDPSVGFYLPIIGGILGVISGIMAAYAYSVERRSVLSKPIPPPVEQPTVDTQVTQQLGHKFCPNCGAKLTGPYCQECGTKVY